MRSILEKYSSSEFKVALIENSESYALERVREYCAQHRNQSNPSSAEFDKVGSGQLMSPSAINCKGHISRMEIR